MSVMFFAFFNFEKPLFVCHSPDLRLCFLHSVVGFPGGYVIFYARKKSLRQRVF
jgi:pilus assembly protein TadC